MKEIKIVVGSFWMAVAAIGVAVVIAAASIVIALQYNKTQWDIANLQKESQATASKNIGDGLHEIGSGICQTSTKSFVFCN